MVHLVLLDMHMPTLTGLETLSIVRQQVNIALPCILITADANDNLMRQAAQAKVYSVIPKPISKNLVLYTVVRRLPVFTAAAPRQRQVAKLNSQ